MGVCSSHGASARASHEIDSNTNSSRHAENNNEKHRYLLQWNRKHSKPEVSEPAPPPHSSPSLSPRDFIIKPETSASDSDSCFRSTDTTASPPSSTAPTRVSSPASTSRRSFLALPQLALRNSPPSVSLSLRAPPTPPSSYSSLASRAVTNDCPPSSSPSLSSVPAPTSTTISASSSSSSSSIGNSSNGGSSVSSPTPPPPPPKSVLILQGHLRDSSFTSFDSLDFTMTNERSETILHVLCKSSNPEIPVLQVALAHGLSRGLDIDAYSGYGETALHNACAFHSYDAIRLLLEYGANPELISLSDRQYPIQYVRGYGNLESLFQKFAKAKYREYVFAALDDHLLKDLISLVSEYVLPDWDVIINAEKIRRTDNKRTKGRKRRTFRH